MARKYCCQCNEQFNIRSNYARCPRCDYELKNIYLFKFLMKDSSIFENNSFFEAYVFTYDLYPSPTNFFPRIHLPSFQDFLDNDKQKKCLRTYE